MYFVLSIYFHANKKKKKGCYVNLYFHRELCNVLELVDNFGFLISFFFDKFICQVQLGLSWSFLNCIVS